jgi:hypothetical protein
MTRAEHRQADPRPGGLLAARERTSQSVHDRPVILVSVSITSAAIAAAAIRDGAPTTVQHLGPTQAAGP